MILKIIILDTLVIIDFGQTLRTYRLFEKLKKLGYIIVIPALLSEKELTYPLTLEIFNELINKKIFELGDRNMYEEVNKIENNSRYMDFGESDVYVTCVKRRIKGVLERIRKVLKKEINEKDVEIWCVIDDKDARKYVQEQGVDILGSNDLLDKLLEAKEISQKELDEILKKLKEALRKKLKNKILSSKI